MEKFGENFYGNGNFKDGVNPNDGLPSGCDPNDFAPKAPSSGNVGVSYEENMAKIREARKQAEANKKEAVPEVDLYTRGRELNRQVNSFAREMRKMADEDLPILVGETEKERGEESRFVGGRIDMSQYRNTPGIGQKVLRDDTNEVASRIKGKRKEIKENAKINAMPNAEQNALAFEERIRQAGILSFLLLKKGMKDEMQFFMSSEYDELAGGVQMFCLGDKGKPLAAINAVLDDGSRRLAVRGQQKRAGIINRGNGIEVKYGLAASGEKGEQREKIKKDTIFNMPLFNVVLNGAELKMLGNAFGTDKELTEDEDKKISEITAHFYRQIDDLGDKMDKVHDDRVQEKCKAFEAALGKIKSRKDVDPMYQEMTRKRESQKELARSVKPKKNKTPWKVNKRPFAF